MHAGHIQQGQREQRGFTVAAAAHQHQQPAKANASNIASTSQNTQITNTGKIMMSV